MNIFRNLLLVATALIALDTNKRVRSFAIINHQKLDQIMGKNQESFDKLNARLDAATNEIAKDLQQLIDEAGDKISAESLAKAEANIARLESFGADVENPVPVPEETEEEGTSTDTTT